MLSVSLFDRSFQIFRSQKGVQAVSLTKFIGIVFEFLS